MLYLLILPCALHHGVVRSPHVRCNCVDFGAQPPIELSFAQQPCNNLISTYSAAPVTFLHVWRQCGWLADQQVCTCLCLTLQLRQQHHLPLIITRILRLTNKCQTRALQHQLILQNDNQTPAIHTGQPLAAHINTSTTPHKHQRPVMLAVPFTLTRTYTPSPHASIHHWSGRVRHQEHCSTLLPQHWNCPA